MRKLFFEWQEKSYDAEKKPWKKILECWKKFRNARKKFETPVSARKNFSGIPNLFPVNFKLAEFFFWHFFESDLIISVNRKRFVPTLNRKRVKKNRLSETRLKFYEHFRTARWTLTFPERIAKYCVLRSVKHSARCGAGPQITIHFNLSNRLHFNCFLRVYKENGKLKNSNALLEQYKNHVQGFE